MNEQSRGTPESGDEPLATHDVRLRLFHLIHLPLDLVEPITANATGTAVRWANCCYDDKRCDRGVVCAGARQVEAKRPKQTKKWGLTVQEGPLNDSCWAWAIYPLNAQIKKKPDTGSQVWQIYRWSWISSCLSCRDIHQVIKRGKLRASETLPADLLTSDWSNLSLHISTDAMVELSDAVFFSSWHNWGKQTVSFLINSCMPFYIGFYKIWDNGI